jgi:hypothetical protein
VSDSHEDLNHFALTYLKNVIVVFFLVVLLVLVIVSVRLWCISIRRIIHADAAVFKTCAGKLARPTQVFKKLLPMRHNPDPTCGIVRHFFPCRSTHSPHALAHVGANRAASRTEFAVLPARRRVRKQP